MLNVAGANQMLARLVLRTQADWRQAGQRCPIGLRFTSQFHHFPVREGENVILPLQARIQYLRRLLLWTTSREIHHDRRQ
ncbi:hypothetical protein, partial [Mesorhizobium sp. M8A.F.Ca.ET.218.01.1.1]|uniref:hypothetical protein n=1 Tax=Mesorhizobium sp. M8A.F.Ca.ET.218.01.1.1 TaxID=2563971 RepID=UPI001AEE0B03